MIRASTATVTVTSATAFSRQRIGSITSQNRPESKNAALIILSTSTDCGRSDEATDQVLKVGTRFAMVLWFERQLVETPLQIVTRTVTTR
jgi:hypothetical protein